MHNDAAVVLQGTFLRKLPKETHEDSYWGHLISMCSVLQRLHLQESPRETHETP